MDPDLMKLLTAEQGANVQAAGKMHVSHLARLSIIADRKFDELDVEQAMANRYATTGTPNEATAAGGKKV